MKFYRDAREDMIRKAKGVISSVIAICLLASCSSEPQITEETAAVTTAATEAPLETVETEATKPTHPPVGYVVSDPEIEKAEGRTKEVYFSRDGELICGRITSPKGKGPFKTIIISHGLYAPLGRYADKAKSYCDKGYAVIEFEYQNATPPETYEDPEYLGDYICEEIKDLYAVIDSLKYLPEVDRSNIYLYGHSMGGLVASYVATFRQDEIKGLILVDPSFYATDLMEFENEQTVTTDIYPLLKECRIPVIIITGTEGSFGEDPNFFDEARKAFPDCRYEVIEGANHIFGGEASEQVVEISVETMKSWG